MTRIRDLSTAEKLFLAFFAPLGIVLLVSLVLCRAYWIPSGSMKPNLLVGDYLLVNRAAYGFPALMCNLGLCDGDMGPFGGLPERGDIATFLHPHRDHHFIKRIVGLPGDTVQMKDGALWLNGARVEAEPLGTFEEPYLLEQGYLVCKNAPVEPGGICVKDQTLERLEGGDGYLVINFRDNLPADNTKAFTVPSGHVFVLGDNRDNSNDSRMEAALGGTGFVPLENMIGRADLIVLSLNGTQGRILRWVE